MKNLATTPATITTILHYYRFNVENASEKEAYNQLKADLKAKGLQLFDSISANHSAWYKEQIQPLDGQPVELETKYLFNNQWNTAPTATSDKGLRVFDWSEAIYPNRKIKEGMYLEQTGEMQELRANTCKCGYCGAQYYKPEQQFCSSCLDSQYLTEENLPLLELHPIAHEDTFKRRATIPESLLLEYQERQRVARAKRLEAKQAKRLESIQADIKASEKEYRAIKWLIDHNVLIDLDNVIYYNHTDTFCIGWRTPIDKRTAEKLDRKLHVEGFATYYTFTIKTSE